jgi:hypothetical protein
MIMPSASMPCAVVPASEGADPMKLDETIVTMDEDPTPPPLPTSSGLGCGNYNQGNKQPVAFHQIETVTKTPIILSPLIQQEAISGQDHDEDCIMDTLTTLPSLIMSSASMPCARMTVSNGADAIMLDETVIVPDEEPTTDNVLKEQPVIFQ